MYWKICRLDALMNNGVIDLQVMGKASIVNCVITLEGLAALLAFKMWAVSSDVSIGGLTEDRLSPKSYGFWSFYIIFATKTDMSGGSTWIHHFLTSIFAWFSAPSSWILGNFSMWWLALNALIWKRGPRHWTDQQPSASQNCAIFLTGNKKVVHGVLYIYIYIHMWDILFIYIYIYWAVKHWAVIKTFPAYSKMFHNGGTIPLASQIAIPGAVVLYSRCLLIVRCAMESFGESNKPMKRNNIYWTSPF